MEIPQVLLALCAITSGLFAAGKSEPLFDEFDGSKLGATKWLLARSQWGGVGANGGVVPENVFLRGGKAIIEGHGDRYAGPVRGVSRQGGKVSRIDHGRRVGACLVTHNAYASGRYEVRMKLPKLVGACSAIWTFQYREFPRGHEEYNARKGTGKMYISNQEIDIELPGRPGFKPGKIGYDWCLCNNWVGVRKQDYTTGFTKLPAAMNDGRFHTWRFDWHTGGGSVEPRVDFYLDGKVIRTIKTHVPVDAGRLWVGMWFPRNWAGKPDFNVQVLEIDWIRIAPFNEPNDRWIYSDRGDSPLLKGPEAWPAHLKGAQIIAAAGSDRADDRVRIVPRPAKLEVAEGTCRLARGGVIEVRGGSITCAELLRQYLESDAGLAMRIGKEAGSIVLELDKTAAALSDEGYRLVSNDKGVRIIAAADAGVFYGIQTLRQLLPTGRPAKTDQFVEIPCVRIEDRPVFRWRGMMLDVSRYFFNKEFVKRYLDMMAMHKLSVLHWHLIDDPGWRLEIKKYPKLTEIGGFRGEGDARYGGFYTQDDIREIVRYAAKRHIRIVPEIELPAHALSAVVAYPHLCCTGKQMKIPTKHFISRDLYCAGKDSTWEFLQDVMKEVCDLFPDTYVHIGGDEAKYDRWKNCPRCQAKIKELGLTSEKRLQGWMTRRIEQIFQKRGKQIIGWDEILGCGISTSAGVMTWHRPRTASDGAKRGNPVVMALTGHCYFDAPESKLPGERPGATWIKPISLRKAYEWDPLPAGLTGNAAKNILGAQGCVWSDQFLHKPFLADRPGEGTARSEQYIEYFSLPRMAALAEVTWTARDKRSWDDFAARMARLMGRYSAAGYHYRLPLPQVSMEKQADGSAKVTAISPVEGGKVHYTADGSEPTADSPQLTEPVAVKKSSDFRAIAIAPLGKVKSLVYQEQAVSVGGGGRGRGRGRHGGGGGNYGAKLGEWKPGMIGSGRPKSVMFDATGLIDRAGTYAVTFIYTRGQHRLDIDGIEVVKNDRDVVAKDLHHGFTGGQRKGNQYTIKVADYETGASYKIRAAIYGDIGDDSNGVVYIKRIK